jgi:archaellum component FlaC
MAKKEKEITLNKETVDVLVTNIIPTTKYFETRFDFMQHQIDETNNGIRKLEQNMNERFEQVDKRFEQVDKRFEEIDRDIRDLRGIVGTLSEKIFELTTEVKTSVRDYIIERDRYYDRKFNNLRMFMVAILVGIGGLFLKLIGFFDKLFK